MWRFQARAAAAATIAGRTAATSSGEARPRTTVWPHRASSPTAPAGARPSPARQQRGGHPPKIDTDPMEGPSYVLVCNRCDERYPPGGEYLLDCCPDGMLVAEYPRLQVRDHLQGLWRFTDWLPVEEPGTAPI